MFRLSYYSIREYRRTGVAFTLMEMLVVMGVISILLVTVLPAFKGMGRAAGQRGAVGTMLGAIDRARIMAISDGLSTYVVFACPAASGTSLKPDLIGAAYAIYEDQDNITFKPVQRTPWIRLPTNVAFKITDDGGSHSSVTSRILIAPGQSNSDPVFPVTASALAGGSGATNVQLPYWKFDATGAVDEQDARFLRVLMFPGIIDATAHEIPTSNNGGAGNTTKAAFYEIDVNAATGRAKFVLNPQDNLVTPTPTP